MARDMRKVTVNLPEADVAFLKGVAAENNISVVDALRRAINAERFFVETEKNRGKVLVESGTTVREVIRK
jgi:hypothetical protein